MHEIVTGSENTVLSRLAVLSLAVGRSAGRPRRTRKDNHTTFLNLYIYIDKEKPATAVREITFLLAYNDATPLVCRKLLKKNVLCRAVLSRRPLLYNHSVVLILRLGWFHL